MSQFTNLLQFAGPDCDVSVTSQGTPWDDFFSCTQCRHVFLEMVDNFAQAHDTARVYRMCCFPFFCSGKKLRVCRTSAASDVSALLQQHLIQQQLDLQNKPKQLQQQPLQFKAPEPAAAAAPAQQTAQLPPRAAQPAQPRAVALQLQKQNQEKAELPASSVVRLANMVRTINQPVGIKYLARSTRQTHTTHPRNW